MEEQNLCSTKMKRAFHILKQLEITRHVWGPKVVVNKDRRTKRTLDHYAFWRGKFLRHCLFLSLEITCHISVNIELGLRPCFVEKYLHVHVDFVSHHFSTWKWIILYHSFEFKILQRDVCWILLESVRSWYTCIKFLQGLQFLYKGLVLILKYCHPEYRSWVHLITNKTKSIFIVSQFLR